MGAGRFSFGVSSRLAESKNANSRSRHDWKLQSAALLIEKFSTCA